LFDNAQFV
jgi:hypothetical protein